MSLTDWGCSSPTPHFVKEGIDGSVTGWVGLRSGHPDHPWGIRLLTVIVGTMGPMFSGMLIVCDLSQIVIPSQLDVDCKSVHFIDRIGLEF